MVHAEHHSSSDHQERLRAKVLTVSDGVAAGVRDDQSGAALVEQLEAAGWEVADHQVTGDGAESVAAALTAMSDGFHGLLVTTGGTGFGPRDQTPEGTALVVDRHAPGLAEAMRLVNPLGRLSRAMAGTRGTTLILNTPGSRKGSEETLGAVLDVVGHAVRLMVDNADPHPAPPSSARS